MTRTLPLTIALAAFLATFPAAGADHCATWSTSNPEADTTTMGGPYYVDLDGIAEGIWIYEESNGLPGLQRGDEMKDDTCHGSIESDTIIL